jgi:DNA-binding NtrC family response regulator
MKNENNHKRILSIEDDPTICRIAERVLTADGFLVDVAANGQVARDIASRVTYDIYLSDIRTPEMNGIEFFNFIKRTYPGLESRVIFTTGDVLSPEVRKFLTSKAIPVLRLIARQTP